MPAVPEPVWAAVEADGPGRRVGMPVQVVAAGSKPAEKKQVEPVEGEERAPDGQALAVPAKTELWLEA